MLCCWGVLPFCVGFIVGEPTPFSFIESLTSSSFQFRSEIRKICPSSPFLIQLEKKKIYIYIYIYIYICPFVVNEKSNKE
jgi:hypothetical protein